MNGALRMPHQVAAPRPSTGPMGRSTGPLAKALGILHAKAGMGGAPPGAYGGMFPGQGRPFGLSKPSLTMPANIPGAVPPGVGNRMGGAPRGTY